MFGKILLFEIQNRIRRPAIYLYFAAALIFTVFAFSTGSLPLGEKEHINSPFMLAMWCAGITMMMMLVSSSVMGMALYRDIEFNTKDYYLTYPITKAGYFWGRYLGSFLCMLFIASAIIIGAFIGTKLGPLMGSKDPKEYGANRLIYYLHPFLTIALPNIFFTSSLFFGLVAMTRNVKVIYTGGILLFLGYFLSLFFLNNTTNATVINLADPFGLSGIRMVANSSNSLQKNNSLFPIHGTYLQNRLIWTGVGLLVLIYTYLRFSFEKFFSGKRDKAAINDEVPIVKRPLIRNVNAHFTGTYNRRIFLALSKLELTNIIRDNYFWIILCSGMVFLGFVFWLGMNEYWVPYLPRTVTLFGIFNEGFPFFIFFIIIFYTGETLHRDRVTRYALINDSLPPPNWVMNGSKLLSLLVLGTALALVPAVLALIVQLAKGFYQFNFPAYSTYVFLIILPQLLCMVMFSYVVHVIINNKFVAHAVGVSFWVVVFFLHQTGIFDYNLLSYAYTPGFSISDMDGLGHMTAPVTWFNLYWLLFGGLLIIISGLFYYRGVLSSFKERLQLIPERFDRKTKLITFIVLLAFAGVGAYIYYNVSYLNNFLTKSEREQRAIIYEKTLKHYQSLTLPKLSRIRMIADLYPDKQRASVYAMLTIVNKNTKPVSELLLDADGLAGYSIKCGGTVLPYASPLMFHRGKFSWFRPEMDTSDFRLYRLPQTMMPGDSLVLELNSFVSQQGFSNNLYSANMLRNGFFFTGGLPGLGYDDDDEIASPYVRKKNGLPPKEEEEVAQDDPEGIGTLKATRSSDLLEMDLTVSTSGDQLVVAQGELQKKWVQGNRNYFHFVQNAPGMYGPIAILSAKFTEFHETVQLEHPVDIGIYYHAPHSANIRRFAEAYSDGLKFFDSVYGTYPFRDIRLAETSVYGPREASLASLDTYAEYNSWNAHFTNANQFDFCYFNTARSLSQQWWRYQVAPNNTVGSLVIPEGLATYSALLMTEKKYGKENIKGIIQDQLWFYLFIRNRLEKHEHPVIRADKWFEWSGKAGVVLYGLRDLIGDNNMNAALLEFKKEFAFRKNPPFAGANDLYRCLQKHTPDSLKYYLEDTWQKITLYDNKVTDAKAVPTGKKDEYKVTVTVDVAKVWIDEKGNDVIARNMNDYIDIGIFAADTNNKEGRSVTNPLNVAKYKLTAGTQTITIIVKGKPVRVGIDPFAKLIDRQPNDNMKDLSNK